MSNYKVVQLTWGKQVNNCKNFSQCFIYPEAENISKKCETKHIKFDQQKVQARLNLNRELVNL